jgi:hypothetical protein
VWCKNFLFWSMTCMLLAPGFGLANEMPAKAPQAFLPESVYEFQSVLEGTQVVHEFVLKNKGDAPLNILQVKSG